MEREIGRMLTKGRPVILGVADHRDQMDTEGPWLFYSVKAATACARRRVAKTGSAMLFDLSESERHLITLSD